MYRNVKPVSLQNRNKNTLIISVNLQAELPHPFMHALITFVLLVKFEPT